MQVSASRERVITKALIEENSYSRLWHPASLYLLHPCSRIVEINNDGDDPLSACPEGAKLENQSCVAILDKGVTIIYVSRLDLMS
jgi:hypothetical protein